MNREIKFRGKRVDNGEWVYGSLLYTQNGCNYILPEDAKLLTQVVEVKPETVGQFIGGKGYEGTYYGRQQNMVDLYEGDIVEAMSEGSKGIFIIKYRVEGNPCWLLYPNWQSKKHWSISFSNIGNNSQIKGDCFYGDLKVIGNIHEHENLLNQ